MWKSARFFVSLEHGKDQPEAHQNADADCRGHSEIDDGGCRPKRADGFSRWTRGRSGLKLPLRV